MRQLTNHDLLEIERELCRRSFAAFARRAWHVLEPESKLEWDWPLDAICTHLQALSEGQIWPPRLMINVPPGTMKSLLSSVMWNAWEWGPFGKPERRFVSTAYKQDLAIRDARKTRILINSDWYQRLWPIQLVKDQNAKSKFENTRTGFRDAMSFTGMTGSRGDRVILDDPLSVDEALSPTELASVETTFREALPTRVNNKHSAIVVIMQRLHERDPSGIIMDDGLPYTKLIIPMRYELDRTTNTTLFTDPRTKDGELMFPSRFPEETVAELEKTLGSYGAAGQLQQRPAPRGGGMFQRRNFSIMTEVPEGTKWIRAWDLAATDDPNAAWTVGLKMGETPDKQFVIADVRRMQGSSQAVEQLLKSVAAGDGRSVFGSIPQDPGQAGKAQASYLIRQLAGYPYRSSPETGDKVTRALPFASQVEAGNVYLMPGEWHKDYLDELEMFPAGRWMDQVDASSRAFNELSQRKRSIMDVM